MSKSKDAMDAEKSIFEGLLEALSDKHSQLDINLQGMRIRLPNTGIGVDLSGLVTVTAHVRDMTDDEKGASAAKNVALMKA